MKLRYFAWVRTRIGLSHEELSLPPDITTVSKLVTWLCTRGDGYQRAFAQPGVVRVAINQTFASSDAPVRDSDEVAFFPPVTGG